MQQDRLADLIRKLTKNNYKITAVTRNIHKAGYILKTQANPGYLNLIELKNFDIEKLITWLEIVRFVLSYWNSL